MPILGNLVEFPLPEVLLLIGTRTGRLRLLDVPEFGVLDIDFSNGEVQSMHVAGNSYIDSNEMIAHLSEVVQLEGGMFEFTMLPVASVSRPQPIRVNELVMSLVCYVDHQMAKQRKASSPQDFYFLESPQPEIWVEPELNDFFLLTRQYLTSGARLPELVQHTKLSSEEVHRNLTNLRLLGVVKLINPNETAEIDEAEVQDKIARKTNDFRRAAHASNEIKHLTSRMPKISQL